VRLHLSAIAALAGAGRFIGPLPLAVGDVGITRSGSGLGNPGVCHLLSGLSCSLCALVIATSGHVLLSTDRRERLT
jgi:hypothetical protein